MGMLHIRSTLRGGVPELSSCQNHESALCLGNVLMKRAPSSSKIAFTLIELLVVIAIIGLLAAIILPVLHILQTNSRKTMARLQMSQIVSAVYDYQAAYNVFPVSTDRKSVV